MGILKHAILPFFALLHGYVAYLILWGNDRSKVVELFQWPPPPDSDGSHVLSDWESHGLGLVGSLEVILTFACVMGVVREDSHFRGVVCIMEGLAWSIGAWDAHRLGFPVGFAAAMAGLAWVGLLVHSQEPGLLTKDHREEASSSQKAKTK